MGQSYTKEAIGAGEDAVLLRIGDLAARTGLTQRAIRYYEELGLLPPPSRTQGDFRLYGEEDVARLEKIVKLRDVFALSLAEVRATIEAEEILDRLRSEYRGTEDVPTRIAKLDEATELTRNQLELLERRVAQMVELKAELETRLARYAQKRQELESGSGGTRREGGRS